MDSLLGLCAWCTDACEYSTFMFCGVNLASGGAPLEYVGVYVTLGRKAAYDVSNF